MGKNILNILSKVNIALVGVLKGVLSKKKRDLSPPVEPSIDSELNPAFGGIPCGEEEE